MRLLKRRAGRFTDGGQNSAGAGGFFQNPKRIGRALHRYEHDAAMTEPKRMTAMAEDAAAFADTYPALAPEDGRRLRLGKIRMASQHRQDEGGCRGDIVGGSGDDIVQPVRCETGRRQGGIDSPNAQPPGLGCAPLPALAIGGDELRPRPFEAGDVLAQGVKGSRLWGHAFFRLCFRWL